MAKRFILLSCCLLTAFSVFGQDAVPVKAVKSGESVLIQEMEHRNWFPGKPAVDDERTNEQKVAQSLLEFAKKHLGCRYQSGGKGPKTFDCSGFVGYVFGNFGYRMNQSSGDQYLQGVSVELGDCVPGDLIFFNGRAIGSRIGHVGIVVSNNPQTGQVQFIHASNSQGIVITKLQNDDYYLKRFKGVKRVL